MGRTENARPRASAAGVWRLAIAVIRLPPSPAAPRRAAPR